jgi:hypothetical protein
MDYLLLLCEQFNKCKGYKNTDLASKNYCDELNNWLDSLSSKNSKYYDFLLECEIDLDSSTLVEINKGIYDSIINPKKVVSPFAYTLKQRNKELFVYKGEPFIVIGNNLIKNKMIDTFITHNPYNKKYIKGLDEIHNYGMDILLGIYGSINDKDKNEKILLLKSFSEQLNDNYDMEYTTYYDNYYGIIFTTNKIKKYQKTR